MACPSGGNEPLGSVGRKRDQQHARGKPPNEPFRDSHHTQLQSKDVNHGARDPARGRFQQRACRVVVSVGGGLGLTLCVNSALPRPPALMAAHLLLSKKFR
jgi:hypothetical protein